MPKIGAQVRLDHALVLKRLTNALRNHRRIVMDREHHGPFEPLRARVSTPKPPLNGSVVTQASWGPLTLLPPAITAASIRSRR